MYIRGQNDTKNAVGLFLAVIFGIFTATFLSYFFHPQQETLNCNANYECRFEQKYYGFIKVIKKFKISLDTLYLPDANNHFVLKATRYRPVEQDGIEYYHIYTDNKNINIKFKNYIHTGEGAFEIMETNERNSFEKYKESPESYSVNASLPLSERLSDISIKVIPSIFLSVLIIAILFSI